MFSTYEQTGLAPVVSNYAHPSHLEAGASAEPDGWAGLLHPDNPMLWLGGLIAVAAGLIGFSGSARVGKAKFSASVDKD